MKIFLFLILSLFFSDEFLELQRDVESGGKQEVVSSAGAIGVAQFMPSTFNWLKETNKIPQYYDINNEEHQIKTQSIYLDYLYQLEWYGVDPIKATIASYNCGRGRVLRSIKENGIYFWEVGLPKETINYLKKLDLYEKF